MDRLFKYLIIVLVTAPLIACQPASKKSGSISANRARRGLVQGGVIPTPGTTPVYNPSAPGAGGGGTGYSAGRLWGAIYAGSSISMADFNLNVHDFVSAFMSPDDLGYVSGYLDDTTGIRFWGYAAPASGVLNRNGGMPYTTVNSAQAELRIVIWDEYAGMVDSNGELITEVPVHIRGGASGWIQGNQAQIKYTDSGGNFFLLNGWFDQNYFQGQIYFDNKDGYKNLMGDFYVSTCQFFKCQ